MEWISVREYCKRKGIKTPQVVYNKIAMNKFEGEWREVDKVVKRKEIAYEE